jgi:hypothetical protein
LVANAPAYSTGVGVAIVVALPAIPEVLAESTPEVPVVRAQPVAMAVVPQAVYSVADYLVIVIYSDASVAVVRRVDTVLPAAPIRSVLRVLRVP